MLSGLPGGTRVDGDGDGAEFGVIGSGGGWSRVPGIPRIELWRLWRSRQPGRQARRLTQ
jgi:hypothetical protein